MEELTARELEVLRYIAEGHSTKEIGARLGITFKTAACHRHRLMQKLDVHGTGALVRHCDRHRHRQRFSLPSRGTAGYSA